MNDMTMVWALGTGTFPVVEVPDGEDKRLSVYLKYGTTFGPCGIVGVGTADSGGTVLAAGGAAEFDALTAFTEAASEWDALTLEATNGYRDWRSVDKWPFELCPENPSLRDVAENCPHGLLVARGLVRLSVTSGAWTWLSPDLPIKINRGR